MNPLLVAEYTKKHGTSFLLICAIFWLNNRLSNVEAKLYDCLEDNIQSQSKNINTESHKYIPTFATLPEERKNGTKRKMAI